MLKTFIIIWGGFFADGEEDIDEGCHSKPALGSSKRNMFVGYQSRDRRLTGLYVSSDLPRLKSDPQGDNGDQWRDGTIQVDIITDSSGVNNLDKLPVRTNNIPSYFNSRRRLHRWTTRGTFFLNKR